MNSLAATMASGATAVTLMACYGVAPCDPDMCGVGGGGGSGGSTSSSSSSSGTTCTHCSEAEVMAGGTSGVTWCMDSQATFDALVTCCQANCAQQCTGDVRCGGTMADVAGCIDCLDPDGASVCFTQVKACGDDL